MDRVLFQSGETKIVESILEHAPPIADKMRFSDKRECKIMGCSPLQALIVPMLDKTSYNLTIIHKDNPVGICGVVDVTHDPDMRIGRIWFLATDELETFKSKFLRWCPVVIEELSQGFDYVENIVPVDNHNTVEWLKFCKFSFNEKTVEIEGHEFFHFVRCVSEKGNVNSKTLRPVMH